MAYAGGRKLASSGYAAPGGGPDDLHAHASNASIRLSALIQHALDVDVVIVDLHPYAKRQRALGAIEKLRTEGTFASLDLAQPSEAQLWRLADPLEAHLQGEVSYAGVPIRDEDDLPLGQIAVIANDGRTFDERAMKALRAAGDLVAELLR